MSIQGWRGCERTHGPVCMPHVFTWVSEGGACVRVCVCKCVCVRVYPYFIMVYCVSCSPPQAQTPCHQLLGWPWRHLALGIPQVKRKGNAVQGLSPFSVLLSRHRIPHEPQRDQRGDRGPCLQHSVSTEL